MATRWSGCPGDGVEDPHRLPILAVLRFDKVADLTLMRQVF